MKFFNHIRAAARALPLLLLAALVPGAALAQSVTTLPYYIDNNGGVTDFGNGPLQFKFLTGSAMVFTSSGSGTGTASASTALTLTATPATPPIVGGFITCQNPSATCSIPASTTVTAYNGTTGITLSASSTVTAQQVNFGAACPAAITASVRGAMTQAGVGGDPPFYTQARLCAYSGFAPGASVLAFPIGAH